MQNPKCIEKIAAHYLSCTFAEASAVATPTKTRIVSISERKDNFSSTTAGGAPCKKKLDFCDQEEDGLDFMTPTTVK